MRKKLFLAAVLAPVLTLGAQVFPLTEISWSNPEFVKRFTGSYGFDASVNPAITAEEKTLFEAVAPIIAANPKGAVTQIQAALTPTSSPALHYTLGNLELQQGNIARAKQHYETAIRAFPSFQRAYKNLGIAHIQEGGFAAAVPMLLKTIELGGQGADVYGLLGYAYLNNGNTEAALRSYDQALFFAPDSRDWRMGKVQCLSNLGRHDEVILMIDQLLREFPTQTDLLLLQANAFVARGETEQAAATLEILRSRRAATGPALILLGDIYLNLQQTDLAHDSYSAAIASGSVDLQRGLRMASRLAGAAAWKEADALLGVLAGMKVETADQARELLALQAQSDLAQGRDEAAAEKLERIVSEDPLNGRALLLLADHHWRSERLELAEIYFERAAKVPAVAADAHLQHGRMLVALRDYRRALDQLERANVLRPQPHVAQFIERVQAASRSAR